MAKASAKKLRALGLSRDDAYRVAAAHNTAVALGASPKRARTLAVDAAAAQSPAVTLNTDVGEEAKIMLGADVAPELRDLWVRQLAGQPDPEPARGPLGMDAERFVLHNQAKALAAQRMRADPRLTEAEAYSNAVIMLAEQRDPSSPI
jgi:hypothetical protein